MKNLSYLPLFAFLFACGENSDNDTKSDFSNITFSIDTVMVDAGDDIINLKNNLWISGVNPTSTHLYNWDQDNSVLEKINLDRLVLEEKLPFEKEGPNGVKSYVSWIYLTDEDQVVFSNFEDMALFTFGGEKLRSYKLRGEEFEGDSILDYESFIRKSVFTSNANEIYGILGSWTGNHFTLAKIDYPAKKIKKKPLPDYDKLADYTVMLKSSNMTTFIAPDQYIDKVEDRIIFSNSVFNSLMVYDLSSDSVYKVDYPTTLSKNSKMGKYRNEVESHEEFNKVENEIDEEINFKQPVYDRESQRFYRFSYEVQSKKTLNIYLTILDRDFQVLAETLVNELGSPPSFHFVKDGKIWIYTNIDDELAFIRLTIL